MKYLNPIDIYVLHHYFLSFNLGGLDKCRDVQESYRRLVKDELLEEVNSVCGITDRGKAYIESLTKIPLPQSYAVWFTEWPINDPC